MAARKRLHKDAAQVAASPLHDLDHARRGQFGASIKICAGFYQILTAAQRTYNETLPLVVGGGQVSAMARTCDA